MKLADGTPAEIFLQVEEALTDILRRLDRIENALFDEDSSGANGATQESMFSYAREKKPCVWCGNEVERARGLTDAAWGKRRFCNQECSTAHVKMIKLNEGFSEALRNNDNEKAQRICAVLSDHRRAWDKRKVWPKEFSRANKWPDER